MNKLLAFLVTLLSISSFLGLLGAFAMVKEPMSEALHFSESFLGTILII